MAFSSVTYVVLIASPGDLPEDRDTVSRAIHDWNDLHAEDIGVTLQPKRWETSATPEHGDRPQAIINKQLVSKADLLIGLFWTRIGTHTGVAESGTVEEIEEVADAGKPVMLYFSERPVSLTTVQLEQLQKLSEFKSKARAAGLPSSYKSLEELHNRMMTDLTRRVRMMKQSGDQNAAAIAADALKAAAREQTWKSFCDKLRSGEFYGIEQGPFLATALLPVMTPSKRLELRLSERDQDTTFLWPPLGSPNGWNTDRYGRSYVRQNTLSARGTREAREPTTVTELTDEGVMLAADGLFVNEVDSEFGKSIRLQGQEQQMFSICAGYVTLLRAIGIQGPIEWRALLTGTAGAKLVPNRSFYWADHHFRPLTADSYEFGPVMLDLSGDNATAPALAEAMRPEFEIIWKDAGLSRDPSFTTNGAFLPGEQ